MCIFNIQVQDSNICQLRLDFLEFEMDGGSSIDKPCDRDAVEIFSGSSNGLGNGRLCGQNTNQHLYIPIDSSQSRPMIRVITDGRFNDNDDTFTSTGYKFRIRIMQLDCTSREERIRELVAPNGCLQYFTTRRGSVTSFNWDPLNRRQYVPDQRYSICFRRQPSDCRLELKRSRLAPPFSTSVRIHIVWKLLKMSHLNFSSLAFSTNFCPIKIDLSGNTVWPKASVFQKLAKMDHFLAFFIHFCPLKM